MGEVYQARDPKLDRDVAINVLPEAFAKDEERLARFEREAKVRKLTLNDLLLDERVTRFEREAKLLAALNHPNIASSRRWMARGTSSE